MRERRRKHDDCHFPRQGRGKRADKPVAIRAARGEGYRITAIEKKTADVFFAKYKGREIDIQREEDGRFYISVTHVESGMHDYDGWMAGSSWSTTIEEAIKDALTGAMLIGA